ncbi:MAG: hypothetical protein Q8P50_07470 [Bacillota bacterium]|nr:hypothetical protein [Bacillota bacterium]
MAGTVQIVIVGPHRWRTFAVFNGNAFPSELCASVDACGSRLSLVFYHASLLPAALSRDAADFRENIESRRVDLEAGLRKRPELSTVAVYDGIGFISEIHNVLNAVKSFLDLYAKLAGKLVNSRNTWTFGTGNIDGKQLSGGRFINSLRSASKTGLYATLADLTLDHSRRWIDEAVTYRHQLSHRSDLDHMVPMHLPLSAVPPHVRFDDLVSPKMPNGTAVHAYVQNVEYELAKYVATSVRLLPNVDLSLISPEGVLRSPPVA